MSQFLIIEVILFSSSAALSLVALYLRVISKKRNDRGKEKEFRSLARTSGFAGVVFLFALLVSEALFPNVVFPFSVVTPDLAGMIGIIEAVVPYVWIGILLYGSITLLTVFFWMVVQVPKLGRLKDFFSKTNIKPEARRDLAGKSLQFAGFSVTTLSIVVGLFKENLETISSPLGVLLFAVILFLLTSEIARSAAFYGYYFIAEMLYMAGLLIVGLAYVWLFSSVLKLGTSIFTSIAVVYMVMVVYFIINSIRTVTGHLLEKV